MGLLEAGYVADRQVAKIKRNPVFRGIIGMARALRERENERWVVGAVIWWFVFNYGTDEHLGSILQYNRYRPPNNEARLLYDKVMTGIILNEWET